MTIREQGAKNLAQLSRPFWAWDLYPAAAAGKSSQ
jgi:hypothetical protein